MPVRRKKNQNPEQEREKITHYLTRSATAHLEKLQMAEGVTTPNPVSTDTEQVISESMGSDQNVILKAINDWGAKLSQRFTTLETAMDNWRRNTDTRLSEVETTLKNREKLITEYSASIEHMDKVAGDVELKLTAYDTKHEQYGQRSDNDRTLLRATVIDLQKQINILERQTKERNVRIQGIKVEENETPRDAVVNMLKHIIPDISKSDVEYAVRIPQKLVRKSDDEVAGQPRVELPPAIILVRFFARGFRNKVFFKSRKDKAKFPTKIIVREDYTKMDYKLWALSKPQMQTAFAEGKKSRFSTGQLTIESVNTPIQGEQKVWAEKLSSFVTEDT